MAGVADRYILRGQLRFTQIPELVEQTLDAHAVLPGDDLDEVLEADAWARAEAARRLGIRTDPSARD